MKPNRLLASFAIALAVLITGCQKDDFVDVPGTIPMIVTTNPSNLATFVPLNMTITATFNVNMNPETFTPESFGLQDTKKGLAEVSTGTLSYDVASKTMSFIPSSPLADSTTYTATIKSTIKDLNGTGLQGNYVWTFATGTLANPTVILTDPLDLATGVALNKTVTATFSEEMDRATLSATTFTLKNGATSVAGDVTYGDSTVCFDPTADLLPGVLYTATITTEVKNASGTPMASDYVWTFTTLGAAPTVAITDPLNLATDVALNKTVTVTFSEAMNGATITALTFTLKDGATPVSGSVNYDGTTATFTPDVELLTGVTYTATITTGAQNLGGTPLADNYVWTFSTGASVPLGPGIVNLGTAGNFAVLSKAGISTTGVTSIVGDIGVSPVSSTAITGFGLIMDASNQFATTPIVTGKVYASDYAAPTPAYITTAISDMETALTTAMGMTLSVITELGAGDISGMTLAPGLYKWGTGLLITDAGVTLSGGPDDTWVFQISSDFTVQGDIVLSGGAQAKNIFWITDTQALLGGGIDFSGNIVAKTLISLVNGTTVNGRLLAQTGVTLDGATIVKP